VTFDRLNGAGGLRSLELDALVAYVSSLPVPRPASVADPRIKRGAEIFASREAQCSSCHDGGGSDGKSHDLKSASPVDRQRAFNTPTLRFVGGTGPYFHDGRHATLLDVLVEEDGKMGHVKHLSREDLEALVAYLRSL
jgi:cytochrome c peroxidase